MAGSEDRDQLDTWLSQQVQPLPPPPGTFELITRRARRRKVRKLAVTLASAVAVAAGAAVAVPNVLTLHLTPSQTNGQPVAVGKTPTASQAQQPNGSGTPQVSPTPALSTKPAATSGPVPPNFQPASVTFVSPRIAWAMGQAGTPGHCQDANPDICTSIVRTDDAGQTWRGVPAPKTGAADGATGVTGIRFLDGVNGWAFGPELWATHDSGTTWHPVAAAAGLRVTDLETAGDRAFALFATCDPTPGNPTPGNPQFNLNCTSYTLMTTMADSDNWVPVGPATNGLTDGGSPTSAVIALTSGNGYLIAPDGSLYSGPLDSAWQKVGSAPCQPGPGRPDGLPAHVLLGLVNQAHLALACTGYAGEPTRVYTSTDSGALWTPAPSPPTGIATSLAAATGGKILKILLAADNGIAVLTVGAGQWQLAKGAPPGGFSYAGMTTSSQGVALPADSGLHEIWMTFDGGLTWAPVTPITPAR